MLTAATMSAIVTGPAGALLGEAAAAVGACVLACCCTTDFTNVSASDAGLNTFADT